MEDLNSFFEEKNMEEYQYLNIIQDIIDKELGKKVEMAKLRVFLVV